MNLNTESPVPSRRRRIAISALLLIGLLAGAAERSAEAADFQPVDSLRQAAEAFVRAQAGAGADVVADSVDARMRLPACAAPLDTSSTNGGGGSARWTVSVRCSAPQAWAVYVPVRVVRRAAVVVAARDLPAGSVLSAADLRVEVRDTGSLSQGYVGDPAQVVGQVLSRPLAAGTSLTPAGLAQAAVVRRGDLVTLVSRSGGFEVRGQGKALANAAPGERLSVENNSSRRIVQGQVAADGTVEIPL